jgi:hypothetical protein
MLGFFGVDPATGMTIPIGVQDALAWTHILETSGEKIIGPHTVIYPADATGLKAILRSGDPRVDSRESFWEAYHAVLVKP